MPPTTPPTTLKELLTDKELAVTKLVALGHVNASIAIALGTKRGTIANHLASIFKKAHCKNRTQLAARWIEESQSHA